MSDINSELQGMRNSSSLAFPEQDMNSKANQPNTSGKQSIGFKLDTEEFLLGMEPVREIIMLPTITYVPHSDAAIEGIFSLRGEILPVLNLRRIMGLSRGEPKATTRVIILHCEEGEFGIIVDDITEFVRISENDAETLDQNIFGPKYQFLSGVSKVGDKMHGILDVAKLIKEFSSINAEAKAP